MARIQQKSSGRRIKLEKIEAASLRSALKSAIEKRGIQLPRFGEFQTLRSTKSKSGS
jgi:hypothetical protein